MPGWRVGPARLRATFITAVLSVAFAAPARADTVVSLTFDDGRATQYGVKSLLASRGMHGTFYVNSAKAGTSSYYMTWQQIADLAADGNEIGGHTLTHVSLTDPALSEAEKRRQVCEDRQNLVARGYSPTSFAYPHGWGDILAESIVRDCGYTTGRRVGGIVSPNWCPTCGTPRAESIPPQDPYLVRTPSFGSAEITLAAIQNVITQAEVSGGWVPLVFHGVCETACEDGWVRPSTLSALLEWLAPRTAHGTVVRTMRDALAPGPPPPPPPPADTTAPNTSITSGPSGKVSSSSATFGFTSTEAASTFECRLDGGAWTTCASPKTYTSVTVGSHTFYVRARDAAGNVDPSPASRSWRRRAAAKSSRTSRASAARSVARRL